MQAAPSISLPADLAVKTLLLTDLVDSTKIVERLGDERAVGVSLRHDRVARDLVARFGGREIDKTDGFLLLFDHPADALACALAYHEALLELSRETGVQLRARAGIHEGEVFLRENPPEDVARGAKPLEVEGIAKPTAARLMSLARGKQTLMTRAAFDEARRSLARGDLSRRELTWLAHGPYRFKGLDKPVEVFEVGVEGFAPLKEPADSDKVKRVVPAGEEITLGWRPAPGQEVPQRAGWILARKLGEGGFGEVWLANGPAPEPRVFKFCFDAERLRALQREATIVRLLRDALGDREDIVAILGWNFDEAPYFLESEYTEGGSLDQWAAEHGGIGGIATLPMADRLELAAEVAEALAAAHSVGVLHKDVKPQNVLITQGSDGHPRARLTDFGIGLVTSERLLIERGITVLGMTELLPNGTSSSRGTQIYMAPELLEGRPATIQADLFALGVMLYQMVAGDLTRALAPGWDRDVEDPLLAADIAWIVDGRPERRPSNAMAVAERLRTLEERRARIEQERRAAEEAEAARLALERAHRRRRLVAAYGAVATVVLIVVTVLAVQSVQARKEADRRRDQAEGLIGFMLGDLRQKLTPVGRLEILDDVGVKAMEYFAAVPEEQLTDDELFRRSTALRQIGEVRIEQGSLASALAPLQESLTLARELVQRDPANGEWQLGLGTSHYWIGFIHWRQGELEPALAQFRIYLDITRTLTAQDPANTTWQIEQAYAHTNIGRVLEAQSKPDEALAEYRSSQRITRALLAKSPGVTEWRLFLAEGHNSIGKVLEKMGRLGDALSEYLADLRIKEFLAAGEPGNMLWQERLGTSHNYVGVVLEALGRPDEAHAQYERAVTLSERLVANDPTNARWRQGLGANHARLGRVLLAHGRAEPALAHFLVQARIADELAAKDPTHLGFRIDQGTSRRAMASALLLRGDPAASRAQARRALDRLEPLAAENPKNSQVRQALAETHILLGRIEERLGRGESARVSWSTALDLLAVDGANDDKGLLTQRTEALLRLGRVEEAQSSVRKLAGFGYRETGFVELCRSKGIVI
jgi:serine/threonine-protein kinase